MYDFNSKLRFTYFYICNILFRVNFIQVFFVNFIKAMCIFFMIASFNSWCDVCDGFSVTNLIAVDVDVDITASGKTQKRTRQRSFSSSEALPKMFNAIRRAVCVQKFQSV